MARWPCDRERTVVWSLARDEFANQNGAAVSLMERARQGTSKICKARNFDITLFDITNILSTVSQAF